LSITFDIIEEIIKDTHIFNNIVFVYHLYVIKVSLKYDITIKWIDIWDSQNVFLNRFFNISYYIITSESKIVEFNCFQFFSHFHFLFWNLRLGFSIILYIIVIHSYNT